ncbi:MAG: hypothetical protein WD342_08910 [Verrucomicrobiales bacterium]
MRIPVAAVLLVALSFSARAQETGSEDAPEAGFLKVVNLVSLATPTYMRLGDFEFDGGRAIPTGDDSGTLALRPDTYTFTVANEGAEPASASIDVEVEDGKNRIVVCYDEIVELRNGRSEAKLRLNLLREAPADEGPRLSLVSLLKRAAVPVEINGEASVLRDRQAHRAEPEIGEVVEVRVENERVGRIEVAEPVHYLAFLYRDPASGEVALSLVRNERLEYHPPLEDDAEE